MYKEILVMKFKLVYNKMDGEEDIVPSLKPLSEEEEQLMMHQ